MEVEKHVSSKGLIDCQFLRKSKWKDYFYGRFSPIAYFESLYIFLHYHVWKIVKLIKLLKMGFSIVDTHLLQ